MIQFQISDFRTIEAASIEIDGITLLTGPMGSGKSTLCQLIYLTGFTSTLFEETTAEYVAETLQQVSRFAFGCLSKMEGGMMSALGRIHEGEDEDEDDDDPEYTSQRILRAYTREIRRPGKVVSREDLKELGDLLGRKITTKEQYLVGLKELDETFDQRHRDEDRIKQSRSTAPLAYLFRRDMDDGEGLLRGQLRVVEDGRPILLPEIDRLEELRPVTDFFYIDTPAVAAMPYLGEKSSYPTHRKDLISMLHMSDLDTDPIGEEERELYRQMKELAGGELEFPLDETKVEEEQNEPHFIEERGLRYLLSHAPLRSMSVALLQGMMRLGYLGYQSVLILDEPEAHLDDEGIRCYARLIAGLHREVGLRLLIATQDPRFIAAMREATEGAMTLYRATPSAKDPSRYTYVKESDK